MSHSPNFSRRIIRRLGILPTEHNPPIAVVNNQDIAGNLGATFAKH